MASTENPKISIVIPCFNEEEALPHSIPILIEILTDLKTKGEISSESYILCVNDNSVDNTWETIKRLNTIYPDVRGISLAHNRGHQFALLAGLMEVKDQCDAAISLDADLQDDPYVIKEMVELYKSGVQIVYGVRKSRDTDTWFKKNSARAFYKLQKIMGLETIYDHADYRLLSNKALNILAQYSEKNLFLRGIIPQIGLSSAKVYYDRSQRVAGESKYPLKKMIAFSIDGITSFSAKPMKWIFLIGLLILFCDIIVALYVLISYFQGSSVGGWSSLMLSTWFIGSLILMGLGIVGEYIGKIFIEVKNRPRFNINERI